MTILRTLAATAAFGLFAGSAFAAFSDMDANGDGALSVDEFATAFPDASTDAFAAIDVNADGGVTEEEYVAAVEAGVLPAE